MSALRHVLWVLNHYTSVNGKARSLKPFARMGASITTDFNTERKAA